MKIKTAIAFALLLIIVSLVCTGCTSSYSVKDIEADYETLQKEFEKDISSKDTTNKKIAKAYNDIFKKISKGDKSQAKEYSELLNEITKQGVSNEKNVFEVASDYADVFGKMSKGFDDFGIQEIYMDKETGDIKIECLDGYGYSVKNLNSNDDHYRDDMGKNVVMICFSDAKKSKKLCEQYPELTPANMKNSENIKVAFEYLDDSVMAVYIGSDEELNIKDVDFTEFAFVKETLVFSKIAG